jgi:hypothetical protein
VANLQEIFSNRELSALFWISLFVIGIQFNSSTRNATLKLLKAFFIPSIVIINLLAVCYSSSIIYLLFKFGFWETTLLKDSIYWFVGSGFIILINLNRASKEEGFFRKIFSDNIKLFLILEFIVNFHQFSLTTELILFPVLVVLAVLQGVAESKDETKKLKTLIEWIFATVGLIVFGLSLWDIWSDFQGFGNIYNLESFLLPLVLSISFIPYAYGVALYMNLETLFIRLEILIKDKTDLRYAKLRSVIRSRLNLGVLKRISIQVNHLSKTPQEKT